ncbi:MarR family transcriptional regulator [Bacillus sp. B190/17]|uniref:MarR family transcriptional regulator n=1 Tax=Bacillus lumedeiriae TaxID=3058829 RepID=A0ABW8IC28_9BACI
MDYYSQKFMRSIQLLRSFSNVQKNMMRFIQKTAADNDLSVPQYTILMAIASHKKMTQKSVGEKTLLPKSTLSQAVDGLVQAGWLNRQQVEGNRREIELTISEQGEAFVKMMHAQEGGIHQVFQSAVELLTDKQYEELLDVHEKISNCLEKQALNKESVKND